jgi:hypothetical protein
MNTNIARVGISFPLQTIMLIDQIRGDVPRSRFILRLVERAFAEERRPSKEEAAK